MIPTTRMPRGKVSSAARRDALAAMKAELYPRRPALTKRGPPTKENPKGPIIGWPQIPKPPVLPKRRARPTARVANKGEGRSDLEILSRLGLGTTYRTPQAGRSTKRGSGTDDLAHALGMVDDPLEQRLALALAVNTVAEWPAIEQLAGAPLLRQLRGSHATRKLVAGKLRHRATLMLREVFWDLVLGRIPRSSFLAAPTMKMKPAEYRALYDSTAGFIETRAHAGAHTAVLALRGEG